MTAIPTATDASAAYATGATPAASTKPSSSDEQDKFLRLLVTQLRNQNPLNPMDNAQITSQMAQISTVSGIEKLNTTLQAMVASSGVGQWLQATAMIGNEVLVPGSTLELQNGAAAGGAELEQAADNVVITIRDGSGAILHQVNLGPQEAGVLSFQWDGVLDSGASAAPGSYSFAVEATQGNQKFEAAPLALGLVGGVTQGQDGVTLKVFGLGTVMLSDIRQVW